MKLTLLLAIILYSFTGLTQRVGLVFSGGGATGFAHIGVLKALEENNIPIDYITGTSSGALVGALYASGYTVQEIEAIAKSEQFYLLSQGLLEKQYEFYLHNSDVDSELLSVKFTQDSIFQKSLPTYLLNSTALDLEILRLLGTNPQTVNQSFDSLFIPFRCIASDIVNKESVLFRSGPLNTAVRASMSYPFFLSPLKVDGKLLFDGGLYNNFPAKELISEFNVDYIIGSNVSYNEPAPMQDDLMSQIKNLFSQHSNYNLPCEEGILIEPDLGNIGTFDFEKISEAIEIGYQSTLAKIDSIKLSVERRVTKEELKQKRAKYLSTKQKFSIANIRTSGLTQEEEAYIERKLIKSKKDEVLDFNTLKYRYLKLYQSDHIVSLFPTIGAFNDSTLSLTIDVKKEKPFEASFGGLFSSKPVNTGFLKASYSDFKVTPITIYANTYFGNFYGSVRAGLKLYLPTKNESYIEPFYSQNRWDYFTSFSTFFEDVKPSFLVLEESFWGAKYNIEIFSKGKLEVSMKNGVNEFSYYQKKDFTNKDTADYTNLLFYSPGFKYIRNTFNRKEFESSGSKFELLGRFVHAIENTTPGSTSPNQESLDNTFRNWFYVQSKFTKYITNKNLYRLGVYLEGYYAFKPFFHNYTVTNLSAQRFNPFPDSKTVFFSDYRANQYGAVGLINIFTIKDKVDLRIEGYFLQPLTSLVNNNGETELSNFLTHNFQMASASVIYHSFVGPVRASFNYYGQQEKPFAFQVSYGYVIFNERSIK